MANIGSLDRTLRFIVGAVLLASPFLPPFAGFFAAWGAWKFAVAAVGLVMLGTAISGSALPTHCLASGPARSARPDPSPAQD